MFSRLSFGKKPTQPIPIPQTKPYNLNFINAPQNEKAKTSMGIEGIDFFWTLQDQYYNQRYLEIYQKGLDLLRKNTIVIPDFIVCTPDIESICTAYLYYYTTLKKTNLPRNPLNIYILQYQQLQSSTINKLQTDLNIFIQQHSTQIHSLPVELFFLDENVNQKNMYQHFIQNQLFRIFKDKINKRQSTTGLGNSSNIRIAAVVNQPFMIQFISNNPRKLIYRSSLNTEPLDIFLERYYANIIIPSTKSTKSIFKLRPLFIFGQDGSRYQIVQIVSNSIQNNEINFSNMNSREAISIPESERKVFLNNMRRLSNAEKRQIISEIENQLIRLSNEQKEDILTELINQLKQSSPERSKSNDSPTHPIFVPPPRRSRSLEKQPYTRTHGGKKKKTSTKKEIVRKSQKK